MGYIGACTARGAASPNTIAAYRTGIEAHLRWCAGRRVDPRICARADIENWRGDMLASGASAGTVMLRLAAARTLYKALQRAGIRPDNPAEYVKSPRADEAPVDRVMRKIVLPEKMAAVLSAFGMDYRDRRDRVIILTLYLLGLRVSEVAGLNWNHWQGETLEFTAKGRQKRSLTVPEPLKEAFTSLKSMTSWEGPMFCAKGGRMSIRGIQKMVNTRLEAAGLENTGRGTRSPHAMRHSCASAAAISGANAYAIQDQMGHSSQRTTSIYTRVAGRFHDAPSMVISKAMGF